jgi:hypothetical protein
MQWILKHIACVLFFSLSINALAQEKKKARGKVIYDNSGEKQIQYITPRIGIAYQKMFFVELGIQKKLESFTHTFNDNKNIYLATDISFTQNLVVGPKIGWEYHLEAVGVGADFTWYTDFHKSMPTVAPKFSISFWQSRLLHITYGYHVPLNNTRIETLGFHRLSLISDFRRR